MRFGRAGIAKMHTCRYANHSNVNKSLATVVDNVDSCSKQDLITVAQYDLQGPWRESKKDQNDFQNWVQRLANLFLNHFRRVSPRYLLPIPALS